MERWKGHPPVILLQSSTRHPMSSPVIKILPGRTPPRKTDWRSGLLLQAPIPMATSFSTCLTGTKSSNGIDWTRRPELSGNLHPFVSGTSQIMAQYTQIAEHWRVDVTPVEAHTVAKSLEEASGKTLEPVLGEAVSDSVFIWADLVQSSDPEEERIIIDAADLLFLKSVWHKTKSDLDSDTQELFFEGSAPGGAQVGLGSFFSLALQQWYQDLGPRPPS